MDFKIGDKLWFVPRSRINKPYEVTVTSVGRKWITIGSMRFDKNTMVVDSGNYFPPGELYKSKEEYESTMIAHNAWLKFRQMVQSNFHKPEHLTAHMINRMIDVVNGTN